MVQTTVPPVTITGKACGRFFGQGFLLPCHKFFRMKKIILCCLVLVAGLSNAQNLPACDSLVISCCTFDSLGPNTLTIYADNHSSVLFDYPAFVLFDAAMDTIAKETVYYFGIGQGFQPHTMDIVAPLHLPFNGKLNLYTLFYSSLDCSFPFYIADTLNGVHELQQSNIKVYPNPAWDEATVELGDMKAGDDLSVAVFDVTGRKVLEQNMDHSPFIIPLNKLGEGMYILKINDAGNQQHYSGKLMVGRRNNK